MSRPALRLVSMPAVLLFVASSLSPVPVLAAGGMSVELGEGTNKTDASLQRLALWWDWAWTRTEGDTSVGGYWEFDVGHWEADEPRADHDEVVEIGFSPVLRFRRDTANGLVPFFDLGVGIQWLSDTRFGGKDISTAVQFSPRIGVGVEFGRARRFELGYRLLHISNASIATPNPGLDFHVLRLAFQF